MALLDSQQERTFRGRTRRSLALTWLAAWLLPLLALSVNPPVPVAIPSALSQQGQGSSSLPPEEDHHQTTTGVKLHTEAIRRARRLAERTAPRPRVALTPRLHSLYKAPVLRDQLLVADASALKQRRTQLPRRTGPSADDDATGLS